MIKKITEQKKGIYWKGGQLMSASGLLSNFLFALLLFHYELFFIFGHFVYLIEV